MFLVVLPSSNCVVIVANLVCSGYLSVTSVDGNFRVNNAVLISPQGRLGISVGGSSSTTSITQSPAPEAILDLAASPTDPTASIALRSLNENAARRIDFWARRNHSDILSATIHSSPNVDS